jgi:hypothetical protein
MAGERFSTAEQEVFRFAKRYGVLAEEVECACGADGLYEGSNALGIDTGRGLAGETEEDGTVSGVASAGEGEGAIEFCAERCNLSEV